MSTLSATITADTSQFNSAVTKAKGELEKLTNVSKKQRTEFDKAVRTIDRVRDGYVKGERATKALNSSVQKLTQLHAELKATNNPLADSILRVANAAAKEKANIDKVASSVKKFKTEADKSGNSLKGLGDSFKDFSTLASAFNSGGLVSALENLAGPLSVITVAFAGLNEVIKNNETLFDEWQGVVSGAGTAWKNFMRTFDFSTIGANFKAGKEFYNASDALGSFRALEAERRASIYEEVQQAKTDKKEGKTWSKKQLETLKKKAESYYDEEGKMLEDVAEKKKATIIKGLDGTSKTLAEDFFKKLDNTKNKYALLEDYKLKYNQANKTIENDAYSIYTGQDGRTFQAKDPKKLKENEAVNAEMEAYGFLIDSEPDIHEYVKLKTDKAVSSTEKSRLIGEILEAAATPDKNEYEKNIKQLYEDLWKKDKVINEELDKDDKDRNTGLLQESIKEYKEIEEKIYKRFSQFESPDSQAFWKEWTNVEHAILDNKDKDKAIEEARSNLLKYANERGLSIDEFIANVEEDQAKIGKDWKWYNEVTDKYNKYKGITDSITSNLGSSEDMKRLIQKSIDKEVTQVTSKYPNPKSQSYFIEIAGIYDKYLKYLVNYENEIESLQRERSKIQQDIAELEEGYVEEELNYLKDNYEAKMRTYQELAAAKDIDPKFVEQAKKNADEAYSVYYDYQYQFLKRLNERKLSLEVLDEKIAELEESTNPYQELKNIRDSKLQEAGIRPYPAFVFNQYKPKDINAQIQAVKDLASAWENLWSVIDTGNDTTNKTIQALGGTVADAANMFKTLAENELAASQAVAMGKATASASGLPFPYNIVAMGTVAATVTSMFARFASIGKFAEGGIVGGNSTIGDYNIARVNSGEMILNGSQQKRLFNMLNGEGGLSDESSGGQKVELVVRGQDLVGVLNNYNKKINKVR